VARAGTDCGFFVRQPGVVPLLRCFSLPHFPDRIRKGTSSASASNGPPGTVAPLQGLLFSPLFPVRFFLSSLSFLPDCGLAPPPTGPLFPPRLEGGGGGGGAGSAGFLVFLLLARFFCLKQSFWATQQFLPLKRESRFTKMVSAVQAVLSQSSYEASGPDFLFPLPSPFFFFSLSFPALLRGAVERT